MNTSNLPPEIQALIKLNKIKYYESAKSGAILALLFSFILILNVMVDLPSGASIVILLVQLTATVLITFRSTRRYAQLRGAYGLTFLQSIGFIAMMMGFCGILYGAINFFLTFEIIPDHYQRMLQAAQLPQEQQKEILNNLALLAESPVSVVLGHMITMYFGGILLGLFVSAYTRTDRKEPRGPHSTNDTQPQGDS